jgi:hypothetical protein
MQAKVREALIEAVVPSLAVHLEPWLSPCISEHKISPGLCSLAELRYYMFSIDINNTDLSQYYLSLLLCTSEVYALSLSILDFCREKDVSFSVSQTLEDIG